MYELKKNGKLFTSKFVGTGPSSDEKSIYRAAVSQRLRKAALDDLSVMLGSVRPNTLNALCQLQVLIMAVLPEQCVEAAVCFVQWNSLSSIGRRLPYVFLSCGHMFGIWQRIHRGQPRRQISWVQKICNTSHIKGLY